MAESHTLVSLRRAVSAKLRMPFYRRIGNSSLVDAGCTTNSIIDTKLTQTDGFWNNHWYFQPSTQECSLIRSFRADADKMFLEIPLANAPAAGVEYEIHSIWNANEIREALNVAIRTARRSFPANTSVISHVVQEDVLTYSLSSLTAVPWIINKVWAERRNSIMRGTVTSATSTTAVLPGVLTDVNSNWVITIYDGTGKGQYRDVVSAAGQEVTVTAWTTIPDSTSKYCLFDESEENVSWRLFTDLRYNSPEFPDTLYLNRTHPDLYGMRLRLEYVGLSSELSSETDTTGIPREFLLARACSELHSQALSSTKADKETHYGEYKRLQEEADQYLIRNAVHIPGTVLLNPDPNEFPYTTSNDNPLAWG